MDDISSKMETQGVDELLLRLLCISISVYFGQLGLLINTEFFGLIDNSCHFLVDLVILVQYTK